MRILGIESSCDDTSVALVKADENGFEIIAEKTASQIEIHKKYGGVVPEVAGRAHAENILPVIELEKISMWCILIKVIIEVIDDLGEIICPPHFGWRRLGAEDFGHAFYAQNFNQGLDIVPVAVIERSLNNRLGAEPLIILHPPNQVGAFFDVIVKGHRTILS